MRQEYHLKRRLDDYLAVRVADLTSELAESCRDAGRVLATQGGLLEKLVAPLKRTALEVQRHGIEQLSHHPTQRHSEPNLECPTFRDAATFSVVPIFPKLSVTALSEPASHELPFPEDDEKKNLSDKNTGAGFFWDDFYK